MSIVMGMQNFIRRYQKVQGIWPVSFFAEFELRQNLDLSQISFDNLIGYILSISMCMQIFITIFFTVLEIWPVSFFAEFELRQRLSQSQMTFDNLLGYILSISMCMQSFITIVHSFRPFSLFQNLELGKASTDKKCQFTISWARSCQYQCLRKSLSKYSTQFKR